MNAWIRQWPFVDIGDRSVDRSGKLNAKTFLACFVPVPRFEQFSLSLRPERRPGSSLLVLKLTTHLLPRNGGSRISEVLGKTPIDFRKLFRCERKLLFSLRIIKAFPKSYGQCRPILGGEFQ